jgi:ABC-type sugar transport system ATPase subunit
VTQAAAAPLLAVRDIHKWYGGVHALRGAAFSLPVQAGVTSLLGENGSGKSTLLGVLSGQIRPDLGTVEFEGQPVDLRSPIDALRHGIAMVSQEIAVAGSLSVAENILLGRRMPKRSGGISWPAARRAARDVLEQLELDYDPSWPVGSLRPDQQQLVEICRALSQNARVLILDEPTSSLSDDEVSGLFAAIRRLREASVSVIFVSHRIPEVLQISDELTILRDGETAVSGPIGQFDSRSIVAAMVGRAKTVEQHSPDMARSPIGPPALQTENLSADSAFQDVSLHVCPGEIVGLAGLVGSGRSELLATLFGSRTPTDGAVMVNGAPYRPESPAIAIDRGIGFLPPDRKLQGLVLRRPIADNLMMAATHNAPRVLPPRRRSESSAVRRLMQRLRIRAASHRADVGTLSGGNQQKVALGKWLACDIGIALLDEPSRGVDVVAKAEIHNQLRDAAKQGMAILVSSSEHTELLALCHRIVVMRRGRVVAEAPRQQFTEADIAHLAGGHVD